MSEEVIHDSWGSRLSGAFKGIVSGVAIFLAAFPLLWWNEGRAVGTAKALTEGAAAVQETASDSVDPQDNGKFVHLTGEATTEEILEDADFGVAVNAIRLERKVEMFQWKEDVTSTTRKKLGGGTETIKKYTYEKKWSDRAISSSNFRDPGHDNPGALPFDGFVKTAEDVRLGEYQLPANLIGMIHQNESLSVSLDDVPDDWRAVVRPEGSNGFYVPHDRTRTQHFNANAQPPIASGPEIGDVRISYEVTRPAMVSVMSQQEGNTFVPFKTSNGKPLNLLAMGSIPASDMISREEAKNTALTWGLRVVGFIMMGVGLGMVFRPLSVLADVLPIAGDFVQAGTGMIAFCIAGACSLGTISVAWVFYRPLIGVPLSVASIGLVVVLVRFVLKARASRAMAPAAETTKVEPTKVESTQPVTDDVSIEDLDEAISV
jgi:hypothetical protein